MFRGDTQYSLENTVGDHSVKFFGEDKTNHSEFSIRIQLPIDAQSAVGAISSYLHEQRIEHSVVDSNAGLEAGLDNLIDNYHSQSKVHNFRLQTNKQRYNEPDARMKVVEGMGVNSANSYLVISTDTFRSLPPKDQEPDILRGKDHLAYAIERVRESFNSIECALQRQGYQTDQIGQYLNSLTVENVRSNLQTDTDPHALSTMNLRPGDDKYPDRSGEPPKGLVLVKIGPNGYQVGGNTQIDLSKIQIQLPTGQVVTYNRKGQVDEVPSRYIEITKAIAEGADVNFSRHVVKEDREKLCAEAMKYGYRSHGLAAEGNITDALMDSMRSLRIMNFVSAGTDMNALNLTDIVTLQTVRSASISKYHMLHAYAAAQTGNLSLMQSYLDRGKTMVEASFEEVSEVANKILEVPDQPADVKLKPADAIRQQVQNHRSQQKFGELAMLHEHLLSGLESCRSSYLQSFRAHGEQTSFSDDHLLVDELLEDYIRTDKMELAAQLRDLIKRRNREDPLEFQKQYTFTPSNPDTL